ncbi:MAG: FAD-binding protein, partial [Microcystaceae cyanobacterium]
MIVCFPYFAEAIAFAQTLAHSSGIVKKQIAVHADPIPTYFTALRDYLLPQNHCVMVILSEYDLFAFQELVKEYAGQITLQKNVSYRGLSLLEFNWNHTTLLARSQDPDLTYLQVFYGDLEKVQHCHDYFGDEVMIHLEFLRFQGRVMPAGLPL